MTKRKEQTGELIRRALCSLLMRKVNDPRLSELISVTEVTLSSDFKQADVFVSILGGATEQKEVLEGFNAASGFLRSELASSLKLRHTPQLIFHYDNSIERGSKLLKLMEQISDDK